MDQRIICSNEFTHHQEWFLVLLTNKFIALALEFAHDKIFSWRKHESKLLQDFIKQLL